MVWVCGAVVSAASRLRQARTRLKHGFGRGAASGDCRGSRNKAASTVLRCPGEWLDRVRRPEECHLFGAGAHALLCATATGAGRRIRAPHRNTFAVARAHQQRPLLGGRRRRLLRPERLDLPRRLALTAFERMHRLLETEDALQRGAHLRKGHIHLQGLVPILQQIGKLALGQLQRPIKGDGSDFLSLAAAIDHPGQLERTERALVGSTLRLFQSSHLSPIAKHQYLPRVTIAVQPEERTQQSPAELQHPPPQAALDPVHRLLLPIALLEKIDDPSHFLEHLLAVDSTDAVVHAFHHGLRGYWLHLTSRPIVAGRSPFVQHQVTTQPPQIPSLHRARRVAPLR